MLSGYNLNMANTAGKKNPADAPSRRPDYLRVPKAAVLLQYLQRAAMQCFVSGSCMLPPSEKIISLKMCHQILLPTAFWRVRQWTTPRMRPAWHRVSLEVIQLRNTAFWPHCYTSTRVTDSSLTVSSKTKCSCTFRLLKGPVLRYFAATMTTRSEGILVCSLS